MISEFVCASVRMSELRVKGIFLRRRWRLESLRHQGQARILWSAKKVAPTLSLHSSVITKSQPGAPPLSLAKEPLMKSILLVLALIALAACGDARDAAHPVSTRATASATMPPARSGRCVDTVLLDDKCTRDWYQCSDVRSNCVRQWDACCHATNAVK